MSGRAFDARDTAKREGGRHQSLGCAVLLRDADPIGQRVHYFEDEANPMTIVGLVEDTTQRSLREEATRIVYTPLSQLSEPEGS